MLGLFSKDRKEKDSTQHLCRLCGSRLSIRQRISGQEFCCAEHRTEFQKDDEELALARLQHRKASVTRPGGDIASDRAVNPAIDPKPIQATAEEDGVEIGPPMGEFVHPEALGLDCALAPSHRDDLDWNAASPSFHLPRLVKINLPENRWEPAGKRYQFLEEMDAGPGELRLILGVPASAVRAPVGAPNCPVFQIASLDCENVPRAARERRESQPPIAGPVKLSGPQSLRFTSSSLPSDTNPEADEGAPAVSGMARWGVRTRLGIPGTVSPRMGALLDLLQPGDRMPIAKPRVPVAPQATARVDDPGNWAMLEDLMTQLAGGMESWPLTAAIPAPFPHAPSNSIRLTPMQHPAHPRAADPAPLMGLSVEAARKMLQVPFLPAWAGMSCPLASMTRVCREADPEMALYDLPLNLRIADDRHADLNECAIGRPTELRDLPVILAQAGSRLAMERTRMNAAEPANFELAGPRGAEWSSLAPGKWRMRVPGVPASSTAVGLPMRPIETSGKPLFVPVVETL